MDIKIDISKTLRKDFNDTLPIRDIFKKVWQAMFAYIANNQGKYQYVEQFANSPYMTRVDKNAVDQHSVHRTGKRYF